MNETNYVLREVHLGACGNHLGVRSLIHKVVRAGYYWPTIQADAKAYVKVCDQCQRFSNIPRQPSEYLTPMMAPWPFSQLGLDILDSFPIGTRQMKFLVVRIDYFKVGRSRTLGKHHTTECKELRLEKHYVQVWGAPSTSVRQWTKI